MNKITLQNIAGYEIEKEEAKKIISFLQNYEEYTKSGITLPKGLLLTGKPGVGKTLFATAIANEANVNFIKFENADQNTIKNIKKYFAKAKESRPSILFIDEIDQMLPDRMSATDLQKKNLQTLLTEIDGIETSEGVLIIATSMYNTDSFRLNPLTRSGRIEKKICLTEPNYETRIKIFDYYLSMHKEFINISRETLAKKTHGFTGASIKRIVNEVLLDMKTKNIPASLGIFEEYYPVIAFNDLKRENSKENLKYIIPHEIGHFITNYILNKEIGSISVAKFSNVAGYHKREYFHDMSCSKQSTFEDELIILLGGMAGEMVVCNDVTTGSSGDIEKAYDMIFEAMQGGLFGFEYYLKDYNDEPYNRYFLNSEKKKEAIEKKQQELMDNAFLRAQQIIKDNIYIYDILIDKLLEKDTLSSEEITKILSDYKNEQKD